MIKENLLYYNEFGGFIEDGKEYVIETTENVTPLPWSHVIANENFGTIVTNNGGGYIWHKNSQSNKITSWSNDFLNDPPSERIVLKTDNRIINVLPYETLKNYRIIYGFGYAKFFYEDDEILISTLIYVPINESKKVYDIKIKSKIESREIRGALLYHMEPVLGVNREFTKKHISLEKTKDGVVIKNKYRENYSDDDVFIKSSKEMVDCDFEDSEVSMEFLIEDMTDYNIQLEVQAEDTTMQNVTDDIVDLKIFWDKKLERIKVFTPVDSMNIMMNGWLIYQTICCRLWARTSFYQAGGAFGFRDQLQDSLTTLWVEPEMCKKQILYHAMHQFEEGDVLHWWHPEKNNGTRTRYTDDLLWLPFVLSKYIEHTGDVGILDEKIPYAKGPVLKEDETERYMETEITEYDDSLYNHAKLAIKKGVKLAENGLPLMNGGDWNDGMNKIKGQSIWLGFFIYDVLSKFKKVCEIKQDIEKIEEYEKLLENLRKSLNENAWDGKWFRRAYFEDNTPVGSHLCDECKIDGISQSWAVISGAADYEKSLQAMESLDAYLVDRENMIIKLLTPPFDKTSLNPGYIKEYIPGVRENGGQYTHGAIWSIIANAILRNGDRSGEYFRILNPIEHARTKDAVLRYKVEPYVVAADVYASPNMLGRGGWTWYTGSSSWLYIAGLEYVLGIKRKGKTIVINPCIPHEWDFFKIEYNFVDTLYIIDVKNPNHKSNGFTSISFDNNFIDTNEIILENDEKRHLIEIVM